jgi:hypothetical protein
MMNPKNSTTIIYREQGSQQWIYTFAHHLEWRLVRLEPQALFFVKHFGEKNFGVLIGELIVIVRFEHVCEMRYVPKASIEYKQHAGETEVCATVKPAPVPTVPVEWKNYSRSDDYTLHHTAKPHQVHEFLQLVSNGSLQMLDSSLQGAVLVSLPTQSASRFGRVAVSPPAFTPPVAPQPAPQKRIWRLFGK